MIRDRASFRYLGIWWCGGKESKQASVGVVLMVQAGERSDQVERGVVLHIKFLILSLPAKPDNFAKVGLQRVAGALPPRK